MPALVTGLGEVRDLVLAEASLFQRSNRLEIQVGCGVLIGAFLLRMLPGKRRSRFDFQQIGGDVLNGQLRHLFQRFRQLRRRLLCQRQHHITGNVPESCTGSRLHRIQCLLRRVHSSETA